MTSREQSCAIAHQSENCIGFFDEILSTRWAQSQLLAFERDRLRSWAESSRALPVGASYLDQRLRRRPRVKQSILELLKVIENCLSTDWLNMANSSASQAGLDAAEVKCWPSCKGEQGQQSRISEAITLLIALNTTIEKSVFKEIYGTGRDMQRIHPMLPENTIPEQSQAHHLTTQEDQKFQGYNTSTYVSSQSDDSDDLGSQLRTHAVRHAQRGEANFWPTTVWKSLLTERSIIAELCRHKYNPEEAAKMASIILDRGSSHRAVVFTILVLIGLTEEIEHILGCNHGIKDTQLPLTRLSDKYGKPLLSDRFGTSIHCCVNKWRSVTLESFLAFQRCLTVPIFSLGERNEIIHSDFDKNVVLPWCKVDATLPLPTSDGHGEYVIVRIHPSCHRFHQVLRPINTVDNVFALKTIRVAEKEHFRDEIKVLQRFNGIVHAHLVTLLSTFSHHYKYYMMFPCFGIDLHRFFEQRQPTPNTGSVSLLRWISKQCVGIMDAVSLIHSQASPTFNHGDIKPENILWYSAQNLYGAEGVLVLSDFGSAGLGSEKSQSMKPNSQIRVVPSYRPPECDMKGGKRSSSFDIWTLGCLFLELVCWFMKGYSGIQRFYEDRRKHVSYRQAHTFYDIKRLNTSEPYKPIFMVKEAVTQKIENLLNDPLCAEWVHDLLHVVCKDMLLVVSKTRQRKTARDLKEMLDHMNSRCEAEERYCSPPELLRHKDQLPEKPFAVLAELNETARKTLDDHRFGLDALENEDVELEEGV